MILRILLFLLLSISTMYGQKRIIAGTDLHITNTGLIIGDLSNKALTNISFDSDSIKFDARTVLHIIDVEIDDSDIFTLDTTGNVILIGTLTAGSMSIPLTTVASVGDAVETVTHNLGYKPTVWVEDTDDGRVIYPAIQHTSVNAFTVTLTATENFTIHYR